MRTGEPLQGIMRSRSLRRVRSGFALSMLSLFPWFCAVPNLVTAEVTGGPPRVRNVYIPSDQLKVLLDDSSQGVLMPREKILSLWQEAQSHLDATEVPPADAVLDRATYEAQLGDHQLRITGHIQIAKLQDGWQAVGLPFGGLAIESARLGDKPARFGIKEDGTLFLLLQKQGRKELKLEMSAPLGSKGGDLATTLKLPPIPASELVIRLNRSNQLLVGETVQVPDDKDNDQQTFRIAVDPSGLVPLVVSDRRQGGNRSPLVFVTSRSIATVEPVGLRWQVALHVDVYARSCDLFKLELPSSVDVAEVEAADLSRWTVQQQGVDTTIVTLEFRKPVLGRRNLRLLGLSGAPSTESWELPTLRVPQAAAHHGEVIVQSSPSLRVEVGTPTCIRPERWSGPTIDPSRKPQTFAFWDENFRLPMRVRPRKRTLSASVASLVDVDRSGVILQSSMTVEPRHAPVFAIQLQLPNRWEVTSVLAAGQPVLWESVQMQPADPPENAPLQTIRFDLAKPLKPDQSLEISLIGEQRRQDWLQQEEGFSELPLPEVRVVGADEVEGTVLVQGPADLELLVFDLSDDLEPIAAERSGAASNETAGTALHYRYQDDARVSGRIRARIKPAKLSVETLAYLRPDHGKLDVHYQLDLEIGQGKLQQLHFTLPTEVGKKIQIVPMGSAARIVQQEPTPITVDSNEDRKLNLWRIEFDRPVTGRLTLTVDFEQLLVTVASGSEVDSSNEANIPTTISVPVLAMQDNARQSGIVALEAASDQQIDCTPENLRELDPADVPQPKSYIPSQRIVAAYQYQRLPYGLILSATRHQSESVLTAVCTTADITSLASPPDRMRHQARFRIRSRNLQEIAVTMPVSANLWSVMLDGEPVEARKNEGVYLVPLPVMSADSASDARDLTLLYETECPWKTVDRWWEHPWSLSIQQFAPEIGMTTLGTTWRVMLPEGKEVVSADGSFTPAVRLSRPTLVNHLAESIAYQSTHGLFWKIGSLVALLVVVGLFTMGREKMGCSTTLVELLVVIVIIGVLVALLLPATQSARESARRNSCMNNLKNIGLALCNYQEAHGRFPPAVIGPPNVPRERQFSWLVALLPYLEQEQLYNSLRLDLPCDHPHNVGLLQSYASIPELMMCPSDPADPATQEGMYRTSYVAVTGADFTDGPGDPRGVIGFDRGLALGEIFDGPDKTIMVAEVTDGGFWYAGGSGTARQIDEWIRNQSWSNHPGGGNVLFADASTHFLHTDTGAQTLRHLATAQGGDSVEEYESGYEYGFSSKSESATTSDMTRDMAAVEQAPAQQAQPMQEDQLATKLPTLQSEDRARLSLRVALETHGQSSICFRREGGAGQLTLQFQNQSFARTLRWALVAAMLLAAWIWRQASGPRRAIALTVALAVPIGLSGIVPLAWTPLLDGLLLGGLAVGGLWILVRIFAMLTEHASQVLVPVIVAGIGLFSPAEVCLAQQAKDIFQESSPNNQPSSSTVTNQKPSSGLTLFIPYDLEEGDPLKNTQVYMPHDEFLRLWKQAHPEPLEPAKPDVRAMVSFAQYVGRMDGDVVHFDARILVHHVDDQWVRVALPIGKVALERVAVDGQTATIDGEPPGIYIEKPGLHVVDVRFQVPLQRLGATGRLTLPLGAVPSGRLLFQLPAEDLEVQVSGAPGGWRLQAAGSALNDSLPDGTAIPNGVVPFVDVPLGNSTDLSIRWQPRQVEARGDCLVSVDQSLLVEVLDSGVNYHGTFRYQVQQGAVQVVEFGIPDDLMIGQVEGLQVADWSIETDPPGGSQAATKRLVATLKADQTAGFELAIKGYRPYPQSANLDVQFVEPLRVTRETGRIAVGCSSHFNVKAGQVDRLIRINHEGLQLPHKPADSSKIFIAHHYNSRPWNLKLQIKRRKPHVEITDRTAVAVTNRQVTLRSLLTAEVSEAPIPSLALRLPVAMRISHVQVPAGADWFVDRDDQGQHLQVILSEPVTGRLELGISGTLARNPDQVEFVVPQVGVEEIQIRNGQLAITLDEDLEAVLEDEGGAQPIDPAALDRSLRPEGRRQVHYAFRYKTPPEGLRLRLAPAPSRASADITSVVSVREGAVAYISQIDFKIQQAGRSQFHLITPRWLGEDIQWHGARIRQIRSQATETDRTWEIQLQQPVRGTYRLQLLQTLPLPGDGTIKAALIRPLDAERSRNYVILENQTADETAVIASRGATAIPISEVPDSLADPVRRQAVAAYRITGTDAPLTWQRRTREQESGLAATISLADITTVVHADGCYRARASYNIRNFRLQFLELELPLDSRVWAIHVSGQPARPAKRLKQGRTITLLPLQKTSAGDFSSKVDLIWSGHLQQPLSRWGEVHPPAPRLVSNVPVSRTLWTIYMPQEYKISLDDHQSNLDEVAALIQQEERKLSFLDEMRQMVQVASSKGTSKAGTKARNNLKQLGSALSNYAQQGAQIDAPAEAENRRAVQQQAQQLEAEIKQLQQTETDAQTVDGDVTFYFRQLPEPAKTPRHLDRLVQELEVRSDLDSAEDKLGRKGQRAETMDESGSRQVQQRGRLREQAVEQLERLQTKQMEMKILQDKSASAESFDLQQQMNAQGELDQPRPTTQFPSTPSLARPVKPTHVAKTGYLSLDLDLAPVGNAYHFRKLQGDPRLILQARHENIGRMLTAALWAGICLALAITIIRVLRRPNATELAQHVWPWLVAAAGVAWLFLLPISLAGLVLTIVAIWTLRSRALLSKSG
jgi:prepilin-type processing-associated H-X9-DG protein